MKRIVRAVRQQVPPLIIEHGLYVAVLGLMSAIAIALGPYLAVSEESPVGRMAFALATSGISLHLLPIAFGSVLLINNVEGLAGPLFLHVYFAAMLPIYFICWLTLPAALFWRLLREDSVPHESDPYVGGMRGPPFAFLILVWSIAAAFSAFGLAAVYGLVMAGFFHRQGYFHEDAATEMLIYSALPCAFAPVILMTMRRAVLAAWRRYWT